jgi:aspartyl-tRNA(Asn)/glutamyl-tRNA(Gln) amidotransferase subunit A
LTWPDLNYYDVRSKILSREISCREVVRHYVDRINQNLHLNAFTAVFADKALVRAQEVDRKIAEGTAGRLAGLVLAVKDIIAIKGEKTTCGSKILSNFNAPYNATVIDKLAQEDVIFIGKTNMDEFAMGSSTENSCFGAVKNPHNPDHVPGGSSGGSAAAVAAKLCMAALGSDTGGSIRQPASFCGVVGMKPTYGRVSRFGLVAFASSLDQIGTITPSVADTALLLETMCGADPLDSTSSSHPVPRYTDLLGRGIEGLRIGLPKEYFAEGMDDAIRSTIEKIADMLKHAGAEIVHVSLPHTEYAIATYYIIATAEASSNLARYDGARYGHRMEDVADLQEMYVKSRTAGFGPEVKRRIMLGTYVLSAGYYDAYYRKAQKVRTCLRQDFDKAFATVDCLLTPTAPTTAFKLNEKTDDPLLMYLSDIYTVSVNLAGLPGITIPVNKDAKGLPIGIQLIGRPFDEGSLIQIGHYIESNCGYSRN